MNILGISALFHDSACCLIQDGRLVAAVEEERFTGRKHDDSIPTRAFKYCLEEGGISLTDVDCVAYYEQPQKKLGRQIWMKLAQLERGGVVRPMPLKRPEWEIRHTLGYTGRLEFFDHHLSHAAGAYLFSGFPEAAILTVDGVGEWTTTSYGRGSGAEIELFEEVEFPHSLGLLYSAITSYLGFSVNDAEYKVMGLAPYGAPRYVEQVRSLISLEAAGGYRLNLEYFDFIGGPKMYSPKLVELFGVAPRVPESEIGTFHQDVARSLQVVLEETLLAKCAYLHERIPSDQLCLSGGVALNCVANGKILREGPFKKVFVQPAASDAGSALGAAALAHVKLTGRRPSKAPLPHVYLGPAYGTAEVEAALDHASIPALRFVGRPRELIAETTRRLVDQKVIGWFQGRMEFGPRALGARSILADPRNSGMRDRINALVKKREAFRPFAPSVLEGEAPRHFDLKHPSRFMLETCQVTSALDLPAITHVDGSARVQTVSESGNSRYAALLRAFHAETGCPILLNTSFNLRGEPIVLTPFDALWCFLRSDIDCLVLGEFLMDRTMIPEHWRELRRESESEAANEAELRAGIDPNVYTFF